MSLVAQPVNPSGVHCFSEGRTLETKDIQLALSVAGVRGAALRTVGRSEARYCLEVTLHEPLVQIAHVMPLTNLLEELCSALGMFEVRHVRGPERRLAGQDAESFEDWLLLNEP